MKPITAKEATELLRHLIRIPSYSRNETEVADYLESWLKDRGLHPNRCGNNVYLQSWEGDEESDGRPTVMLNAHLDTVKPVSGWTKDPFGAEEIDGCIYGLGSNDCGGGLVSLLSVFTHLCQKEQKYRLIWAASCEEEVSGRNGMERLLGELPKIDVAIVGEPTGMRMAVAEKGLMVLDCTAKGAAGHAARREGDNAIYKALRDIEWFRTYQFPKVSETLGAVLMTVTMIQAGTQHNVIPDRCEFTVDVRTNDCYDNVGLLTLIRQHVACEVRERSTRLNSSSIGKDHPIVRRGHSMGLESYGSPTLSDQALMPFPSLKLGPGESSRSHTADEYICRKEIESAIGLYTEMLDGLDIVG